MSNKVSRNDFIKNGLQKFLAWIIPGKKPVSYKATNLYHYDIDKFLKTPKKSLLYHEINQVNIPLKYPKAIALNKKDNLYVIGDNSLLIYNESFNIKKTTNLNSTPHCIALNENDKIRYLTELDGAEYLENAKNYLKDIFSCEIEIYSGDEKNIYDPANRARNAIPLRPAIYIN